MSEQVMVRQPRLQGDSPLRRAEVISRKGDLLQIKYPGDLKVTEVNASQVIPAAKINGGQPRVNSGHAAQRIHQQFPESRSALGNIIR